MRQGIRTHKSLSPARRVVAAATLMMGVALGQTLLVAPAASGIDVNATVPNQYAVVYRCTAWAPWHCAWAYTYQTNPPYCRVCPSVYHRVNQTVWYWV